MQHHPGAEQSNPQHATGLIQYPLCLIFNQPNLQNMKIKEIGFLFLVTILFTIGCADPEQKGTGKENLPSDVYELVIDWPKIPEGFVLGNPTGLGIDSDGNIVVFHRASRVWQEPMPETKIRENTISTFDRHTGEILNSWGSDLFIMPHGLEVDSENNIWVTDVALHQVFKFSPDGTLLLTLGEAGIPGDGSLHFNLPTDIAVTDNGTFYVSDGYGNSRVVKFTADGNYLFEWGKFGNKPGEFNTPHGIDTDRHGNVYVADRENNRIQKFDADGNFITLWQNSVTDQLYAVAIDNQNDHLFGIDYYTVNDTTVIGSDIFRFDLDTNLQLQFGRTCCYDGPISRYHDILIDDEGSIYAGDIFGNSVQKFRLIPSTDGE